MCRKGRNALPLRNRCSSGHSGDDNTLGDIWQRIFHFKGSSRSAERADTRTVIVSDSKGIERINLFADCTVQARISRVESCHNLAFAFGLFHNINHLLQRHGCTVIYHTALFFQIQQCRIDKRTCINDNVRLAKQLLSSYRNQIRGSRARSNKMYHLFFPLFFYNNQ